MNPAFLNLLVFAIEEAVKEVPVLATELNVLFSKKGGPTPEDWAALRARVVAKSYEDYVPATAIPPAA